MPDRPTIGSIADELLEPEQPSFFDDLWREIERRDHRAAKRWRLAALGLAAALVTSLAATGVVAAPFRHANTVDTTVECAAQLQGRRPTISLATVATRSQSGAALSGRPQESQLLVSTGGDADFGTRVLQLDAALKGYLLNASRCAASKDKAHPERRTLRLTDYLRAGGTWGHVYRCDVARIRLRLHLTIGKNGVPSRAQVAVETLAKQPLLYVDWQPRLVQVYEASACETTGIGF